MINSKFLEGMNFANYTSYIYRKIHRLWWNYFVFSTRYVNYSAQIYSRRNELNWSFYEQRYKYIILK